MGVELNAETEPQKWFDFVCDQIRPYTQLFGGRNMETAENEDTFVVMGTQMIDNIQTDSQITSCLLSMPRSVMKIGTAYFNLAEKYREILLKTYGGMVQGAAGNLEILTAAEQCNSFYKAPG